MERPRLYRLFSTLILYTPFLVSQASGASVHQRQNVAPPTELPDAWSYQGCYVDSVDQRTLRGATFGSIDQSAATCISFCTARGYLVAGTEYSNECFCGNSVSTSAKLAPDGCSMGCSGDATEACGGPNQISVYKRLPLDNQNATFEHIGRTGNWSSLGCYSDAAGARLLSNGGIVEGGAQNVSAESCIASCEASKYKYAGTEYSYECYCGNSLESDHEEQEDGCDMTCTGNSTQFCGGANRINVYGVNITRSMTSSSLFVLPSSTAFSSSVASTSSSTLPSSSSIIVSSSAIPSSSLDLTSSSTAASSSLEVSASSSEVSSSSDIPISTTQTPTSRTASSSQVSSTTPASSVEDGIAGGEPPNSSTSIATNSTSLSISLVSSTMTSAPPGNTTVPEKKKGWHYEGCHTDGVGGRTLSIGTAVPGTMTNAKCQAACRTAGYTLAGTEYSAECYCDNRLRGRGALAPDGEAQCNMPCSGNATDICGGPNRLSIYKFYTGDESTVSASATSSSAVPIATGLPKNFTYKGCYVDGPGFRIMNFGQPDDQDMTIALCANTCAILGYEIAGMEYSVQCFCDNLIRMGGKPATSDEECSNPCAGNPDQKCGGPSRLSIWSSQATLKVIQVPKPVQNVSDWTYQGCITDYAGPQGQKVFPWQSVNQTGNSPEWCLGKCAEYGYMAAGLEYGEECYCGDIDGVEKHGAEEVAETECATPCPGNPEAICGQGNRLSWYKWEGDPLYVWHYPTGTAAGRYEFLVGGPIIPLISQPGVNGKISLLEKHGTGAPNTTGAYELDPSIGGDIFHAFRELKGIKTDIFCAAGLTMPDRAGRQINIGGWSLDSLFGVRVYWPDGSLGVNGTNDWQEDVNIVKLQRGRWYPTGLVMANGSMLIVGGQDGSNGPPVPNMEILPQVGPVLEAQYLRDTDPYNLYPYLVVLPSGGIFIQYYNEARILDEVTLDTIKILPKAPGSVNDPKAGRTYPYEGTQVLLPQYYPYSAPLEVLICGGAAKWPRWGLDNCITIEPDVTNPTWTIERMPSRRVMSCMATLPDGTFLILNGAETGEAGFGLADNSNLNAVLYDPSKPRNQRMSVMANTTIPRMYHSEAVVMDDGRVLVSGSDPQDQGKHPQEYRLEVFLPPYLLSGAAQPSFTIADIDWDWEGQYAFTVSGASGGIRVSLMGSESSTHGSSMGARILFPQVSCAGASCTVTAPKGPYVAPVGWYRMFVLAGSTPSHATWVRIGGDPGELGNWPNAPAFQPLPGLGPVAGRDANMRMANFTTNATMERRYQS